MLVSIISSHVLPANLPDAHMEHSCSNHTAARRYHGDSVNSLRVCVFVSVACAQLFNFTAAQLLDEVEINLTVDGCFTLQYFLQLNWQLFSVSGFVEELFSVCITTQKESCCCHGWEAVQAGNTSISSRTTRFCLYSDTCSYQIVKTEKLQQEEAFSIQKQEGNCSVRLK